MHGRVSGATNGIMVSGAMEMMFENQEVHNQRSKNKHFQRSSN